MAARLSAVLFSIFFIWSGSCLASDMSISPKLGCFPIIAKNLEAMSFAENLTSLLSSNLDRAGFFEIAERRKLESTIEFEGLRINTLSKEDLYNIGRKSGLDFVLSGSVTRVDGAMDVEVRLLNVRTAKTTYYETIRMADYELAARSQKITADIIAKAGEHPVEPLKAATVEKAPLPPASIELSGSSSKVRLKWMVPGASQAAGFKVFRAYSDRGPFAHIASCTEPSYTDENLKVNEAYYYRVKSITAAGMESEFSATVVGRTSVAPQPPILLTASSEIKAAQLVWRPRQVEGNDSRLVIAGYKVYRKKAGDRDFLEIANCSQNDTRYTDSGLKEGPVYSYAVTSFNSGKVESEFSTAMNASPLSASRLRLERLVKREVTLQWDTAENEAVKGYHVYRSENGHDNFKKIATVSGRKAFSHTDTAPEISKAYWYGITAYDDAKVETALSEPLPVTTEGRLPVPAGMTASGDGFRKITLNWQTAGTDKDGIKGYLVYRSEERDAPLQKIADVSYKKNSHTDDNKKMLGDGKTYFYRISCYDTTGGESPTSEPVSATTKGLPAVPKNLRAVSGEAGKISLSWDKSPESEIKAYEIYRGQPDNAVVVMIDRAKGISFTDSGVKNGTEYIYAIKAVNDDNMTSPLTTAVNAGTKPLPVKLQDVRIEAKDGKRVLCWGPSSEKDVRTYNVYKKNFMGLITKAASVMTNSFQLDNLKGEVDLFVAALDDDGLESERVEVVSKK